MRTAIAADRCEEPFNGSLYLPQATAAILGHFEGKQPIYTNQITFGK